MEGKILVLPSLVKLKKEISMSFWSTIKSWVLAFFVKSDKLDILDVLESLEGFLDSALIVVEKIDKVVKPALKEMASKDPEGVEAQFLELVTIFVESFGDIVASTIDIKELADKLFLLPIGEICFNLALAVLGAQSKSNASLSILRLAIELAYNVYKNNQK